MYDTKVILIVLDHYTVIEADGVVQTGHPRKTWQDGVEEDVRSLSA